MREHKNWLSLEIVWKDDWALEQEFTVSNNGYSGIAGGYDTADSLTTLAKQLEGFPAGDDQSILYEIKEEKEPGHLSISFRPITALGLVGVNIHLESEGSMHCQSSTLSTELLVEPNAIDVFQKYLTTMAENQAGIATLVAR